MARPYPSDITDAQWRAIAPLLRDGREGRRGPTTNLRDVINAIVYRLRTNCSWRMLPHDFPPWGTVHFYYWRWEADGSWQRIQDRLHLARRTRKRQREENSKP